jgi:hypothetical protein
VVNGVAGVDGLTNGWYENICGAGVNEKGIAKLGLTENRAVMADAPAAVGVTVPITFEVTPGVRGFGNVVKGIDRKIAGAGEECVKLCWPNIGNATGVVPYEVASMVGNIGNTVAVDCVLTLTGELQEQWRLPWWREILKIPGTPYCLPWSRGWWSYSSDGANVNAVDKIIFVTGILLDPMVGKPCG